MNSDAFVGFIQMGGYGGYVWSAYGITLMALLLHYFYARRQFQKSRRSASLMVHSSQHSGARTVTMKDLP